MLQANINKAQRLLSKTKRRKLKGPKFYRRHEPETESLTTEKARNPNESSSILGIKGTIKSNLILGARSFRYKPYHGHTLNEQIKHAQILSNSTNRYVYVDLCYRGVDADSPIESIKHRGKSKRLTEKGRHLRKQRQAIDPINGHQKADHRMSSCYLKGQTDDAIQAELSPAGYNIRWLLRMMHDKSISLFCRSKRDLDWQHFSGLFGWR